MSKGVLYLLTAEFFFALGTVIVKHITAETSISGIEIALFRFFTGFVIISTGVVISGKKIRPNKKSYVFLRAFFNTISVIFFFLGVEYSNVSKANLLNMTYPVFVMFLSPLINRERSDNSIYLYLAVIMTGIYLIIVPGGGSPVFGAINRGDIFSLLSGVTSGFAISFLRESRKYDSVHVILLYMLATGAVIGGVISVQSFILPQLKYLLYMIFIGIISLIGQSLITTGYKYIDAAPGSLVSSSRILFGIVFGAVIFSDPVTIRIIAGGIMIAVSLAGVNGFFGYMLNKKGG